MKIYSVTFARHREIYNYREVEEKLYNIITELLQTKEFIDFYVGNDGEFDITATSIIRTLRKDIRDDNSTLNLVLPYPKANMDMFEEAFDSVFIPEEISRCPPRAAIPARNKWLAKYCDLMICYVVHPGGAEKTMKCAEKFGKQIIKL